MGQGRVQLFPCRRCVHCTLHHGQGCGTRHQGMAGVLGCDVDSGRAAEARRCRLPTSAYALPGHRPMARRRAAATCQRLRRACQPRGGIRDHARAAACADPGLCQNAAAGAAQDRRRAARCRCLGNARPRVEFTAAAATAAGGGRWRCRPQGPGDLGNLGVLHPTLLRRRQRCRRHADLGRADSRTVAAGLGRVGRSGRGGHGAQRPGPAAQHGVQREPAAQVEA